jgi:hypothetical protein
VISIRPRRSGVRGECLQAKFRDASRFAQERIRMLQALSQLYFQRLDGKRADGIGSAGFQPGIIAGDQSGHPLLAISCFCAHKTLRDCSSLLRTRFAV